MKRVGLVMAMAARLWAQDPPQAANPAPAQAASASQAASPVPKPSEPVWSGYIVLGYQWRSDVGGSLATYRSIVNLGSGPKLIGADLTVVDPKHRAFDQIYVRACSWTTSPIRPSIWTRRNRKSTISARIIAISLAITICRLTPIRC